MRVRGTVILLAALGAAAAQASSIVTLEPSAATPSVVTLGDAAAIDPSIVAATPAKADETPSIAVLADTPAGETPSIVTLGEPAQAGEADDLASAPSDGMPRVIRGGDAGPASAKPQAAPDQAATQPPLLDPNDRGTPAKRKALKRQAERLAREAAEAAARNQQPDASTEPAPAGH